MPEIKSKMKTFLRSTSSLLRPSDSHAASPGFQKAPTSTSLFPTVDPAVDGEDCLLDCASCTVHLPKKFSIDEDDVLYGHVKGWDTHLVVATGKTDWVRDVADEEGSVMQAVGKYGQELKNGKVMLSASNMPTPGGKDGVEVKTRVLLLPAWKVVEDVGPKDVPGLLEEVVQRAVTNVSPLMEETNGGVSGDMSAVDGGTNGHTDAKEHSLSQEEPDMAAVPLKETRSRKGITPSLPLKFSIHDCPHRAIILMCSQKTRDARCGQSAPLLRKELERHLRPLGLYRDPHDERPGGVGIYYISHVGGHKYSANVMVYRREGKEWSGARLNPNAVQGIWLARVRPEDCENIVAGDLEACFMVVDLIPSVFPSTGIVQNDRGVQKLLTERRDRLACSCKEIPPLCPVNIMP